MSVVFFHLFELLRLGVFSDDDLNILKVREYRGPGLANMGHLSLMAGDCSCDLQTALIDRLETYGLLSTTLISPCYLLRGWLKDWAPDHDQPDRPNVFRLCNQQQNAAMP
jgi:hypothetical protein